MAGVEEYLFSTSFNNIFPTSEGYVARQTGPSDTLAEGMTFRWFHNGSARLTIPMDLLHSEPMTAPYSIYSEFVNVLRTRHFNGKIGDFSLCSVLLTALVGKYIKLRKISNILGPFYAKAKLYDVWRVIPFVNMKSYVVHIERWGIPVIQQNEAFAPAGVKPETLLRLDPSAKLINDDEGSAGLMTALPLAGAVLWAAGVGALEDPTNVIEFSAAMMEAASFRKAKNVLPSVPASASRR